MKKYKVAVANADSYKAETVNDAVNELMTLLGKDLKNPFGDIISPGMTVFIKPNWVASRWRESCPHRDNLYSVITHPTVIEAVADRVALALNGKGKIIIADNPSIDANFDELMDFTGIKKLENKYNVDCKIMDLRPLVCENLEYYGKKDKMTNQRGDPDGEICINLGKKSMLYGMDPEQFRGVFDERSETVNSHTDDRQLYTYSKSLYNADVYISIPKMKTHQKVGATLNLKGLVGSITQKNQLVHWRVGTPETGGDEYPSLKAMEKSAKANVTHRGAWPGNDTIWRMVVDLYQGLLLKDRKYFTIVDGIIAGEGQGPFCPSSKAANVLVAGDDLLSVDIATVRLMGLDPLKIKYLKHFIDSGAISLDDIIIYGKQYSEALLLNKEDRFFDFAVPDIWKSVKI